MPDCLEMPYKPAIVGAHEPAECEKRWRMGGTSCLAGDYYGDWAFDHELKVGERIVFEDMIHYTMVKTTMFNGVAHPAIVIALSLIHIYYALRDAYRISLFQIHVLRRDDFDMLVLRGDDGHEVLLSLIHISCRA